jgi:glutamate-ammonia-ligase adenylyltransferase
MAWEWLAYVKLRAAAGDMGLGARVETEARRIIHEAALREDTDVLRAETLRVRERLESEKGARRAAGKIDIKYGPGGMLDVYFATRFLQLRDNVPDDGADRSTRATLESLRRAGPLAEQDYEALAAGYALLRELDHWLRLVVGRSTRLPSPDHPALCDIARKLGHDSAPSLLETLSRHTQAIRAAYERIMKSSDD